MFHLRDALDFGLRSADYQTKSWTSSMCVRSGCVGRLQIRITILYRLQTSSFLTMLPETIAPMFPSSNALAITISRKMQKRSGDNTQSCYTPTTVWNQSVKLLSTLTVLEGHTIKIEIFIITVGFLDPENIPMRNIFKKIGREDKNPGVASTPLRRFRLAKYLGCLREDPMRVKIRVSQGLGQT